MKVRFLSKEKSKKKEASSFKGFFSARNSIHTIISKILILEDEIKKSLDLMKS